MSSPSSSSEHSDFNFNHSPTGSLSSGYSSESDNSLNFTPFDYLTTSNNILSDPPLHEDHEVFMGLSEGELIPLPLYSDMLDESMSSDAGGSLSLSISFKGSSRHGSEEELDRDDPFWEFIDEPKYPQKEKETEEYCELDDEGEDEEISDEQEDEENEDDESSYDGDDDED